MKTNFCFISRHFNGGEYFSWYFHGAQEESSLDHEFHKCMFHGHENKDNQFFMALSRLFNINWSHSVCRTLSFMQLTQGTVVGSSQDNREAM